MRCFSNFQFNILGFARLMPAHHQLATLPPSFHPLPKIPPLLHPSNKQHRLALKKISAW